MLLKYAQFGILMWTTAMLVQGDPCSKTFPCKITRIKKMIAADCYKLDFRMVPTCLSGNIEILDLSYNRIKKLKKNDIDNYSSLKVLYLSDNMIMSIEDEFFSSATSLSVLDLSRNGISYLPPLIFNLPSLNKLYLSENFNLNIVEAVDVAKPLRSPLEKLDISFNELDTLPDLGEMIDLIEYNISGNNIENLSSKYFAGLCNLHLLHHDNMSVTFATPCECWNINSWLQKRNVLFKPFECYEVPQDKCKLEIDQEELAIYNKCKETHKTVKTRAAILKIALPCIGVLVLIMAVVIYCIIRKRNQKNRIRQWKDTNEKELKNILPKK